jgi:hypothetical protein
MAGVRLASMDGAGWTVEAVDPVLDQAARWQPYARWSAGCPDRDQLGRGQIDVGGTLIQSAERELHAAISREREALG